MKFPIRYGTGEIQESQKKARGCYLASTKRIKVKTEVGSISRGSEGSKDQTVCTLEILEESPRNWQPHEEIRSIPLDKRDPAKAFKIGTTLRAEHEAMLIRVLSEYRDIFAWEPKYARGGPEVLVPKPNGKWRNCTDFTSIDKACPKDCYPMPNIDRLVDSSTGYKVVDFLDAFQGYHQIFMSKEDVEKTAFVTEYVIYY
ncbi:hypothetical protein LIER_14145 [Lithospermum erythrorhizon]|uniref:Reverse transcriptase domain-containing protein n=1 Tax=Lithospermum erythrorhizon TaxID=34254 RepID=A0AAV3Q0C3_LITER